MPYTAEEQEIYDFIRQSLPRFLFAMDRVEEVTGAIVKAFDSVRNEVSAKFAAALIANATSGPPDILNLHAIDRGTYRQDGELDPELRARLKTVESTITPPAIFAAIDAIVEAAGLSTDPGIVELRNDKAFVQTVASDTGTGGVFAGPTGSIMQFTPDTNFAIMDKAIASNSNYSPQVVGSQVVFSGSASAGNDGTFVITGVEDNTIGYINGSGVAETDATVTWTNDLKDDLGNVLAGRALSYIDRGHRVGGDVQIVVILPLGCTSGLELAVAEEMRRKRAAGLVVAVECRKNP